MPKRIDLKNNQISGNMVTMQKKFFVPSVMEMLFYSLMMLILLNGSILLVFTLLSKLTYFAIFQKAWIILIFIPLLTGIVQPLTNRDGLLTLKGVKDLQALQLKHGELLKHFDYIETGRDDHSIYLDYRTNWKRFMHFNKGQVRISIGQDEVQVYGKKQILDFLETKMLFGKEFKSLNAHKLK
jgi:hypothetical protein